MRGSKVGLVLCCSGQALPSVASAFSDGGVGRRFPSPAGWGVTRGCLERAWLRAPNAAGGLGDVKGMVPRLCLLHYARW